MSFLRNIRNSISRGNSSTRDSTPNSRRSSSVDSTPNRSDSVERKPDGLQRSETFTLEDEETIRVKVKASKKEKVLNKFSTFTKRKKSPAAAAPPCVEEIQKNTYYKWRSGIVADPVEAALDPFNVLYEQPSSLKSDLSGQSYSRPKVPIDCSTYRKNRVPSQFREQLEQLKNHPEISEEIENDPDKFRTITINSFRKSFRDKFLATQNEVPHNPSWFVEVEPPPGADSIDDDQGKRKDARSDVLLFENENYRPTSRSPVRKRSPLRKWSPVRNKSPVMSESGGHPVRATARSAVKRTDTFKVERPLTEPSIRIEIKNSITPNQPGRLVPVGVAKPMPSQAIIQPLRNNRFESPVRGLSHHQSSGRGEHLKPGRYQTCIHITSNEPITSKDPIRIQISENGRLPLRFSAKKPDPPARKKTYFGDNITRGMHHPLHQLHPLQPPVKSRQYIQHPDEYSYTRPSRPTSGLISRNDANRSSMTQPVPRRSRSPIKVPWR